jgi:hypothetical protein
MCRSTTLDECQPARRQCRYSDKYLFASVRHARTPHLPSQASHEFGSLHLFNLLTEARLRNQRLQITGHLLYFEGRFTQCIEGPTASIDQLWQSLQRDDRHHDVQLLGRYAIEERRFPEWTMAFSSYQSLYVHGMTGFFPVDDGGDSPLVTICSTQSEVSGDTEVGLQQQG